MAQSSRGLFAAEGPDTPGEEDCWAADSSFVSATVAFGSRSARALECDEKQPWKFVKCSRLGGYQPEQAMGPRAP